MLTNFRKKLANFIYNGNQHSNRFESDSSAKVAVNIDVQSLNFSLIKANGGHIVNCSTYDRNKQEHRFEAYLIFDGQDLCEEIGKIISLESLKL